MKKIYLLLIFLIIDLPIFCQGKIIDTILYKDNQVKVVKFVEGKDNVPIDSSISFIKKYFKVPNFYEFKVKSVRKDARGMVHTRYLQLYHGIRVEPATIIVHSRGNQIVLINGDVATTNNISISPLMSSSHIVPLVTNEINAIKYAWDDDNLKDWIKENNMDEDLTLYPEPELVIWNDLKDKTSSLCYKVKILATDPLSYQAYFVNALSGNIMHIYNLMEDAIGTAVTRYSGTVNINTTLLSGNYVLRDNTRGLGIETKNSQSTTYLSGPNVIDFKDNNNYWNEHHNSYKDDAALDAHYAAEKTYDYFLNTFGRNSWDGAGAKIRIFAHYGLNECNSYWWDSPADCITLGDGDDVRTDAVASCDAVAHEFAHQLTDAFEDYMEQEGEPATIVEGLGDIWGACVETYANIPGNLPWFVGEDYYIESGHRINLQYPNDSHYHVDFNLSNPEHPYPDAYLGPNWFTGSDDDYGIHFNSSVLSHWFYLLAIGGGSYDDNYNEMGTHYAISGIGVSKAAEIVYSFYDYIYPSVNMVYLAYFTTAYASDTWGSNSNEAIQTWNAWHAVGVWPWEVPVLISGNYCCICNSVTTSYSLPTELSGATITWSTSDNIQIVSGQNTRTVNVTKKPNNPINNGTITATYNHGNGNLISQKNVVVGTPYIDPATIQFTCVEGQGYWCSNAFGNEFSFTYSYDYNYFDVKLTNLSETQTLEQIRIYGTEGTLSYFPPEGTYKLWIRGNNDCGTGGWSKTTVDYVDCGFGLLSLKFFPNPTISEITISIVSSNNDILTVDEYEEWELEVYTQSQILKVKKPNIKGHNYILNTSGWKDGIYFVRVNYKDKILIGKFIISNK